LLLAAAAVNTEQQRSNPNEADHPKIDNLNMLKLFQNRKVQTNVERSLKIPLILKFDSYHFVKLYVILNAGHLIFRNNSAISFDSPKCMNSWF